jgi:hypothetical protein
MTVLLLDGPRNGDYATVADGFESGYVFDEPTSTAWVATGEAGGVMLHAPLARLEETQRRLGLTGYIEVLAEIEAEGTVAEVCPWNSQAPLNLFMADKITADALDKLLVVV